MHILVLTDYSEVWESIHEADTSEKRQNIFLFPLILNCDCPRKPLLRELVNTHVSDPG